MGNGNTRQRQEKREAELAELRGELDLWGPAVVLRERQASDPIWIARELRSDWVLEELERPQELSVEILRLRDFADDREAHLLPIRFAYLEQLLATGQVAQVAYQAFKAGWEWYRVQGHVMKVRDLERYAGPGRKVKEAARDGGRTRRGFRKVPEEQIRDVWQITRRRNPHDEVTAIDRKVGDRLGVGERTVRRYRSGA